MKILYGIQGTGNGHISRSRILAKELKKQGIMVDFLLSGRAKEKFFDMEVFGQFEHRRGLTFITENGEVNYLKTGLKNNIFKFLADIIQLDLSKYDLIITDFEPVTAWAAKIKGVPIIGIGHQYAFGSNTPKSKDSWLTRNIMKYFAPATYRIGLHWYPYDECVFPPIVDIELARRENKQHILVYLPFENQESITQLLQQFPNTQFIQYSPDLNDGKTNNVSLRKTSHTQFKHDLMHANGVICNAGFELISECLHIGIPVLTKALNGQMEQHSNALALKQLDYATVIETFTFEQITYWLTHKKSANIPPLPNVAAEIATLIANNQYQNISQSPLKLWAN
ncbi:glycosyltransferase family protein [Colwellia sp. 1_MG-2023]|uniref:MJ1255/VC2487 family glycosyltransferase n=1 Tax=Colwellia sp. 1_MG-2023 TaxID=3062649 RepID=UPI0026E1842F|nr:MJ1255/VC2487 family glycosyltransferase [Colwellia sp. 1_MG-2023]MDO6444930.1 glycosyltransferase family protein [Colwellia sp. 1_MG-2023]